MGVPLGRRLILSEHRTGPNQEGPTVFQYKTNAFDILIISNSLKGHYLFDKWINNPL